MYVRSLLLLDAYSDRRTMTAKFTTFFAAAILTCSATWADVRVPRLFADNMILQQQTKNAIWGWADQGESVMVKASWGAEAAAKADSKGRWKLFLATPVHGTGYSLSIKGENTIRIKNVAIGEVWLCAGQSNMGWSTANSFEAEKEARVDLPNFRVFKSQREHWHEPLEESRDRLQQWKPCNPKSAAETSAVSYYFGKTLHQRLGVPVGIIVQAYAGTPIEGWMPWDIQKDDLRSIEHKKSLDINAKRRIARGETAEKALGTFDKELVAYNAKIDAGETMKNAFRPLQPPFITKPATLGHQYPAHIFNAMIHPIRPYGIRGMIWYQGERNSKNVQQAVHHGRQLEKLIRYYRSSWHEQSAGNVPDDFPVQITQLPSWNPPQTKPVEGLEAPWAANRESMRRLARKDASVGMAVSIDTGDAVALHPKNKKPIGVRHALLAMQQTYREDIVGRGPRYLARRVAGRTVVIEFDSIGSGLKAARPEPLGAFAIAGKDRRWHWASAKISGNTVVVSSEKVAEPAAVRYAWAMNPSQRNLLYNKEGLPASPFRTDDWPLFDPDEEIVEVDKPEKPPGYQAVDWDRPAMKQAVFKTEKQPAGSREPRGEQFSAPIRLQDLYAPQVFQGMPVRVMKPLKFDERNKYPVIVSLHGAGGKGTNNGKQLKDWNRQLAGEQRRREFPCYVVAPQAAELWNADHLKKIKAIIKTLPAVDMDRIYVLGHSMGGHGTYIFIQLDPDYFAAAAPSAGSGLRRTEKFIEPVKIKDVPIWAFHGDKDGVCPIEKDQAVFDEMKRLGGNMKFTIWKDDRHAVSGKMIVGGENGTTHFSGDRCDKEPNFMKWLFAQSRKNQREMN